MEPQEIDSALDELENRLDRLRSLYEQYFMGIEKIEPTVPRKDVDRRFWILRRTPIRNTARRFRLQTLIQRYNTFQQHWTRICREIENGTYVRHLLRAQKKFGAEPKTWAAKKRLGLFRRDRPNSEAPSAGDAPSVPPPSTASQPPDSVAASPAAPRSRPSAVPGAFSSRPPPPSFASRNAAPSAPPAAPPADVNLAPLDLDLEEAPTLPPPPGGFRRAAQPASPAAAPAPSSSIPRPPGSRPSPIPLPGGRSRLSSPVPRAPAVPGGAPALRPPVATGAKPAAPAATGAHPTTSAVGAPSGAATAPRPALRQAAPPAAPRVAPGAPTSAVTSARSAPAATPPTPQGTPARAAPPAPAGAGASMPAKVAPAAVPASGLSDERVRQLHADLSSARQKLNQASTLSVDSLAKSLRETEAKLRAQHGGRSVDFQVVIKDGKPIVKPVVRR